MKQKLLFAVFALLLLAGNIKAQTGYIYIHEKTLNEQASVPFTYNLYLSSNLSTPISTFQLDNNPAYINAGDIGASHSFSGTAADGELWVIATGVEGTSPNNIIGTIYHRASGGSQWAAATAGTGTTSATSIDGAYQNQCVYISAGSIYFYNNGTVVRIYNGSTTAALDVTAGGGNIAAVIGTTIRRYSLTYGNGTAPLTTGTWTNTNITASRLDLNVGGTTIAFINATGIVSTVPWGSLTTTVQYTNATGTAGEPDVAYDDKGFLFAVLLSPTNTYDVVYSNTSGSWAYEPQSRLVERITGGAGGQVWGVINYGKPNTIWARVTDGSTVWFDDERVRTASVGTVYTHPNTGGVTTTSGVTNGDAIMIPVTSGVSYTLVQTLPSSSWDLGRYVTYAPSGYTMSTTVSTQTVTFTASSNTVAHIEFIDELLSPKSILLNCTAQALETFGTGTNTYGDTVQGTGYHYSPEPNAQDGDYQLVKNTSNWFVNTGLVSEEGDGGYFLLVNASYATDEFYRKRVTNLVPGLSYTISFYAANVNPGQAILPNVLYGLQDLSGNIINSSNTGNIPVSQITWELFSLTFTATTATADLFLRNNNIGGLGNDIAIDEIALNPVITPLPNITVTPTIAPNICIGTSYTFANSQSGGEWATSNSSIATINPNTGIAQGLTAGDAVITYQYTNAINCVSTTTTGIIVSSPPTFSASDQLGTGTACLNQTDSLYSSASGGTTPYTYAWVASPSSGAGLSTANIANTAATPTISGSYTYTATVTDNVGCTASSSVPITVSSHPVPTVTASTSAGPYCLSSAITLNSTATGGSGVYTYKWTAAPSATAGIASSTSQNTTATPTASGAYAFKMTVNDGFCSVPKTATSVTVNAKPTVSVGGPSSPVGICSGGTITLTSTPSGGTTPYAYNWSGTSTPTANGGLLSTNVQNPVAKPAAGLTLLTPDTYTYTLVLTDANGCTATNNIVEKVYLGGVGTAPTITVASYVPSSPTTVCAGTALTLDATITGGTANFHYVWTGGVGTISNGSSGSTASRSYNSATVSTGAIFTTTTGSYTLTVTDQLGCVAAANTPSVTVNPTPSVATNTFATDICMGTNTTVDSLYSSASGGSGTYSAFAWSTTSVPSGGTVTYGAQTKDTTAITVNKTGLYTFKVTVTDANTCTATANATVTAISQSGPTVSMPAAGTLCINVAATLNSNATAGSSSTLTYAWTASPTTGAGLPGTLTNSTVTVTPTAQGSYTYAIKVTDGNNCSVEGQSGLQVVNAAITAVPIGSTSSICTTGSGVGNASGTFALTGIVSGGNGSYTYAWSGAVVTTPGSTTVSPTSSTTTSSTTATITSATAGTSQFDYTLSVTDGAGCTGSGTTANISLVTGPSVNTPTITAAAKPCINKTIDLSGTISGGTTPYSYVWIPPTGATVATANGSTSSTTVTTTATATVSGTNTFIFQVQDANSCAAGASDSITIYSNPSSKITVDKTTACLTPATTVNLTGSILTATVSPYTYSWIGSGVVNSNTTTTTATPIATSTYKFTVTDANGCTGTGTSSTVTVDAATPSISNNCQPTYDNLFESNGVSWLWTTSSAGRFYTDATYSVLTDSSTSHLQAPYIKATGNYSVTITDANSCTGSGSITIGTCGLVLTVDLLTFTAEKQHSTVLLDWSTATETNNDHFVIQRSSEGLSWQDIGTVKGHNNSTVLQNYSFTDITPITGMNYYRLKLVQTDGNVSYSGVRKVQFAGDWIVHLYPNPAQDYLVLEFNSDREEKASLVIQTALGSSIFIKDQYLVKGLNRITLNQVQPLAQGTYFITLQTTTNMYRAKFVKADK